MGQFVERRRMVIFRAVEEIDGGQIYGIGARAIERFGSAVTDSRALRHVSNDPLTIDDRLIVASLDSRDLLDRQILALFNVEDVVIAQHETGFVVRADFTLLSIRIATFGHFPKDD